MKWYIYILYIYNEYVYIYMYCIHVTCIDNIHVHSDTCRAMVSSCLELHVQSSGQGSAFNNSPAPFASPRPFSDKSTSTQPGNLHSSDQFCSMGCSPDVLSQRLVCSPHFTGFHGISVLSVQVAVKIGQFHLSENRALQNPMIHGHFLHIFTIQMVFCLDIHRVWDSQGGGSACENVGHVPFRLTVAREDQGGLAPGHES